MNITPAIIQEPPAKLPPLKPVMTCLPLPAFDVRDLNAVREMFRPVARHPLGQAWLEKEEPDFTPAHVSAAWRGNTLLVFAELMDVDIFNAASGLNQRVWELGDTFEMFLRPTDQSAYVEFQVAPNNQRLQLSYPNAGAVEKVRKTGSIDSVVIRHDAFRSWTWVLASAKYWCVYAELEATELGERSGSLLGRQWEFSFARYDYTRSRKEPVISSTSPHAKPDFHRQQEWGMINFKKQV